MPKKGPRQIPLDLATVTVATGRENYFVSGSNGIAFNLVENWQDWPQRKLIVTGDAGAGKSHLARIWAENTDAHVISGLDMVTADIELLARGNAVVEDLGLLIGDRDAETQLFHLHNLLLAEGHALLMTARQPPNRMNFVLPDLQSRLGATTIAPLEAPDDPLLGALLVKLFADRQIHISAKLLGYVLPRIERSFEAAQNFVDEMDARALDEQRKIGQKLARDVMGSALDKDGEKVP